MRSENSLPAFFLLLLLSSCSRAGHPHFMQNRRRRHNNKSNFLSLISRRQQKALKSLFIFIFHRPSLEQEETHSITGKQRRTLNEEHFPQSMQVYARSKPPFWVGDCWCSFKLNGNLQEARREMLKACL